MGDILKPTNIGIHRTLIYLLGPHNARDLCTPGCNIRLTREISQSSENMIVAEDFVLYGGVTYRP